MKLPWSKSPTDPIQEFWTWFSSRASDFDLMKPANQKELGRRLGRIHSRLVWGASPGENGVPTKLEICAGGARELIPTVKAMVDASPNLPGWIFVAFRQPAETFSLRMGPHEINPTVVQWVDKGRSNGYVDIDLFVPLPDDTARKNLGFIALDHSVGEYLVMTRLGGIEFFPSSDAPEGARPLSELAAYLTLE